MQHLTPSTDAVRVEYLLQLHLVVTFVVHSCARDRFKHAASIYKHDGPQQSEKPPPLLMDSLAVFQLPKQPNRAAVHRFDFSCSTSLLVLFSS